MKSSSCLCLGINFFRNHRNHNVFIPSADNHVQGVLLFDDITDIIGSDHRLSIDADDDVIFLEPSSFCGVSGMTSMIYAPRLHPGSLGDDPSVLWLC